MPLYLEYAPVAILHQEIADKLGVHLLESCPPDGWRSSMVVEYPDGCTAAILVDHSPPGPKAWQEYELSKIVRNMVRVELQNSWFISPQTIASLPEGCAAHMCLPWRRQHFVW